MPASAAEGGFLHFCFVDESGTPPGRPNPKKPYFTMGAAIVDCAKWGDLSNRIKGFKTRHGLRGELKWRYLSPHNDQEQNPFLRFDATQRRALGMELASIIAGSDLTIIACVVDVEAAFRYNAVTDQQTLYHFTYKPITERFQYFLQGVDDHGIIVADHRGGDSDKLLRAHHAALTTSHKSTRSGYSRLVEGLFLQDSDHSVGIQVADFVAGAIHRAYSTRDSGHAAALKARIRKNHQGNVLGHGIVQHPKSGFRSRLWGTPGGAVAPTP